jgi:hypothetical protein
LAVVAECTEVEKLLCFRTSSGRRVLDFLFLLGFSCAGKEEGSMIIDMKYSKIHISRGLLRNAFSKMPGDIAAGKGPLEVVAPAGPVKVHHLAAEEEPL